MEILFVIGRVLFGGFFLINGINHFRNHKILTSYAASQKVPAPGLAVIFTGLLMFFGGLGILTGLYTQIALWLVVIFLLPAAFMMHKFWKETDPNMKMYQTIFFLRNLALIGAALMIMSMPEPWPFSL